ncbi:MAG: energy-coupling factor transporter transmembrane component T family protein [Promethearchaeota archaeon]
MSLLQGFHFEMADSPLHRLDPRTKMAITGVYFALAVMFVEVLPLLVLLVSLIPLMFLGKIAGKWIQTLRGLLVFVLFVLILNTVIQGFNFAAAMTLRILVLMTTFSVFFLTVHPDDLALAMVAMRVPYNFAFSMSLAFRFVPTLADEAQTIMDAQQSRGLELRSGNFVQRVRNLVPIIIPLVVCSIRRALQVAESLDSRAFGSATDRTSLKELHMSWVDWLVVGVYASFLAFGIYVRVVGAAVFPLVAFEIPL